MKPGFCIQLVGSMLAGAISLGCSADIDEGDAAAFDVGEEDIASASQALASGSYGWVWADKLTGDYDPSTLYSFNSAEGTNRIEHQGEGRYRVELPELGGDGGNVQVTAYGNDATRCKVESWGKTLEGAMSVLVRCHTAQGTAKNSQFVASYFRPSANDQGAFVWASKETTASYSASATYSWNSEGGTNTVEREGIGLYSVYLPGQSTEGNAAVTAYGSGAEHCKVRSWTSSSGGVRVRVACFAATGSAVDTKFSLSYATRVPAPFNWGGYAWANDSTSSDYVPELYYSDTSAYGLAGIGDWESHPRAGRKATGTYFVYYPYLRSVESMSHATAYGSGSEYCKLKNWANDDGGTLVDVLCFDAAGAPVNSRFVQRYMYSGVQVF